jgi:hypothetical protein
MVLFVAIACLRPWPLLFPRFAADLAISDLSSLGDAPNSTLAAFNTIVPYTVRMNRDTRQLNSDMLAKLA